MNASPVYRLRAAEPLALRAFGDEIVAFNPATWETHVLDGAAAILLGELERGPRPLAALTQSIAQAAGTDEGAAAFTAALLEQMVAAAIVEAVPVAAPR